jgi:carboxymethylenebutenolidase
MHHRMFVWICGLFLIAATTVVAYEHRSSTSLDTLAYEEPLRSTLPSEGNAKDILNATHHHGEWVRIPAGSTTVLAWVVYPDRNDRASVVILNSSTETMTDFHRAVADQLTLEGYIAIVPNVISDMTPVAGFADLAEARRAMQAAVTSLGEDELRQRMSGVRQYARNIQSGNGTVVSMTFDISERILVSTPGRTLTFPLTQDAWHEIVRFINTAMRNRAILSTAVMAHSGHSMAAKPQATSGQRGATPRYPIGKPANLPAGLFNAGSVVANSTVRSEWVDIPLGNVKLHTRVTYPRTGGKSGLVVLMQHGPGLDDSMLAYADQLALDGFIAIAPDLHSGLGPNGGNFNSFRFTDDVMKATARLTPEDMMARYRAAREYGLKLSESNGKSAALGFCMGGTNVYRFAAEVQQLNAGVVFYGGGIDSGGLARINAPLIGFFGEDDARLTSTVPNTAAEMKRLGKSFEYYIYPHATHGFLYFQDLAGNPEATADSWPKAMAFLKKHLQ